MADVTLVQSGSNNGTVTPATPGSLTLTAGNAALVLVAALGTSPTITGPGSTTNIQKIQGATLAFGMFIRNTFTGGAFNPSYTLGGTVTGWVAAMFEFSAMGSNTGIQGSASQASAIAQLTNIFPAAGNTLSNELFVYAVARATATMTPQNSFMGPLAAWSASVQPQAGVQGLSLDFFWASGLGQGVGQYPSSSGLLSGAVASVAIGAWFNTIATQPSNNDNIYGNNGVLVGGNYQGMLGG